MNSEIRRKVKRKPLYPDEPQTLAELFEQACSKSPRQNALNYKENGKWYMISSEEMVERAKNIAAGLVSQGLTKGNKAVILAPNSPKWTLTDAGCQFAGIVDIPIYTTLTPESIKYIINDSEAKVLFLNDLETFKRIEEIVPECKKLDKLVFFESEKIDSEDALTLKELENLGEEALSNNRSLIEELTKSIKSNDVATLIYTSGTTGKPKGVMLSHENLISNVIDAGEHFGVTKEDIPLSVLPLSHVFERTGMYLYVFNGMAVYFAESIEKVPENLQEVRPTILVGVPRIFEKTYAKAKLMAANESVLKEKVFDWAFRTAKEFAAKKAHNQHISLVLSVKHSVADKLIYSKLRAFFGGRLKFCITGGAALSDSIYLIFTGAGISIMQGYGLTETSPVISTNNPVNFKLGRVGKPIRNVKVRIAEDGEVEASGPNVMLGYYNKQEATKEAFTEDGWFKTGDIGEIDDEDYLKITDRKKELFKTSGGKYIAPSPIEQMIKSSRFVNQVVLIGNSRKFVSALIVPNFEQLEGFLKKLDIVKSSLKEICRNKEVIDLFENEVEKNCTGLARFETVKRIILLENELTVKGGELTPTLKIKRRVVDEKYRELINQLYVDA